MVDAAKTDLVLLMGAVGSESIDPSTSREEGPWSREIRADAGSMSRARIECTPRLGRIRVRDEGMPVEGSPREHELQQNHLTPYGSVRTPPP